MPCHASGCFGALWKSWASKSTACLGYCAIGECSRDAPECRRMLRNAPECLWMPRHASECFGMLPHAEECSGIPPGSGFTKKDSYIFLGQTGRNLECRCIPGIIPNVFVFLVGEGVSDKKFPLLMDALGCFGMPWDAAACVLPP